MFRTAHERAVAQEAPFVKVYVRTEDWEMQSLFIYSGHGVVTALPPMHCSSYIVYLGNSSSPLGIAIRILPYLDFIIDTPITTHPFLIERIS